MSEPVRTYIGCRRRAPATELIRLVASAPLVRARNSSVGVDARHRAAGRGGVGTTIRNASRWARRRNAFRRALRVSGPLDDSLA
ncbi:hypothetical protein TPAU25S_03252 [Tsukamurella paurometabola]